MTSQSETGELISVILKKPVDAFISDLRITAEYKYLNYKGKPDLSKAIEEYEFFLNVFRERNVQIYFLTSDGALTMDSIYCRDAAIATNRGIILCSMGKEARRGEEIRIEALCLQQGLEILGKIEYPGMVEGGDVAWVNENTLAAACSYRTNPEGIRQLRSLLEPWGNRVLQVDLPHHKGPGDVFHLMSIFSPVRPDLAVVYSPLMPVSFRNFLLNQDIKLIEVPDKELETLGCNVLALSPEVCLMTGPNRTTQNKLEKQGVEVLWFEGSEICQKGGGGPTCLTRPLRRKF